MSETGSSTSFVYYGIVVPYLNNMVFEMLKNYLIGTENNLEYQSTRKKVIITAIVKKHILARAICTTKHSK